jgi:hypothetical protein
MTTEKQLHRLRENISKVAQTLELFLEPAIQPSTDECLALQQQLAELQENIAVYKHIKTQRELSPSFNLHSKVSEQTAIPVEDKKSEISVEPIIEPPKKEVSKVIETTIPLKGEVIQTTEITSDRKMEINLNDKFRFINELFKQNQLEYALAIEQLNTISDAKEADNYLMSLRNIYAWDEKQEVVKRLYLLVQQRFS